MVDQAASVGAPCWVELMTPDQDASASFYGELFGWGQLDGGEEFGGYRQFLRDGQAVAGFMKGDRGSPHVWGVYLFAPDAAETARRAAAAGGTVTVAPVQVGDLGHMAWVNDPAGAAIGIWQPLGFRGGWAEGELNAPVWFETLSRDYERSVAFYRDAFGWDAHTMSDTAEFRYTTLGAGDGAKAGIMDAAGFLAAGVPSHWQFYVQVVDADAAAAAVGHLGGAVIHAPHDTPYGRLAALADPHGARFCVMSR